MAGREGGLGARSRGLRLLSSPQAQDGGLDSGLGTCSPTSEDRGIASSLGVAEGVDWLDAVVERLQTVFVIRGEGERREGGRRRRRKKAQEEQMGEKNKEEQSITAQKHQNFRGKRANEDKRAIANNLAEVIDALCR